MFNINAPLKENNYEDFYTIRVYLYDKFNNVKEAANVRDIKLKVVKNHLPKLDLT